MTLHWWMHWFWITRAAVVLALLLVSPSVAAPPLEPYALPLEQEDQPELLDGSHSPGWPSQHVSSTDMWDFFHLSTTSSIDHLSPSSVEWWPTAPSGSSVGSVIAEASASTYLPLETDMGEMKPILFTKSSDSGHIISQPITQTTSVSEVPVKKLTTVISNVDSEKLNFSEQTTVSIKSVPKTTVTELDRSVVIVSKEVGDTELLAVSGENTSVNNSEISLDPIMDTISSHSQGVDKPIVNVPRLITRELKNNSHNATSLFPSVASHGSAQENPDAQPLLISPVMQLPPITNAREGKAANYIKSPLHLHPLSASTPLPLELISESATHSPNEFLRGVLQSYKPGPKISDDGKARLAEEAERTEYDESNSRIFLITHNVSSDRRKLVPEDKGEENGARSRPLEDAEMGDSPYEPPESSTIFSSKQRVLGETPMPSDDFVLPTDRIVGSTNQEHASHEKGHGKDSPKITPPILATSSKAVNTTSGRSHDNATRSSYIPPMASKSSEVDPSSFNSTEHTNAATFVHETVQKVTNSTIPSSSPTGNTVPPATDDLNETTIDMVETTVVPISNRVQAPAPPGSGHGLDAASITGISLGILVFAALIGAVSFVLYRRRFLNKPQTLNDKCSNPDSSGYIDDSTLRENSEEMYSLDNDSFLNSLEAMTIQNYWTDNVKHTKL